MNNTVGNRSETILEHLALDGLIHRLKALEVTADALSWHRIFGALLLVLLVLLFLSGAFMAFYYSPAPGSAYDSVDYALFTLPFGDVIKGIHHYGWNLVLHRYRVLLFVVLPTSQNWTMLILLPLR